MRFDVFLSHNGQEKPVIRSLGKSLQKRGLRVWLDEWELRPGLTWQTALDEIIANCNSAAVCFGGKGIGPWEEPEMQALLRRFVKERKSGNVLPIIPVLLPGAPDDVKLPSFLESFTWVDLRKGLTPEGLERLQWGITGERLRDDSPTVCLAKVTPDLRNVRETVAKYLTSARLNVLPTKPYSADAEKFLAAFEADLAQADVFVQILGATYDDRDELPEGVEQAQFDRATQHGKKILQWRDKSVVVEKIDDDSHRELVGGANVICNDLTEFAKHVVDQAQRVHEVGRPAANAGGPNWWALIKADKPDNVVANEVSAALAAADVKCRVTRTGKSVMEWLREIPYDAVLIVCGSCSDEWLEQLGDELMAVDRNLKDQGPVRAYYVCTDEPIVPYRAKSVLQVKHRDPASWENLMATIRKRGGQS